MTPDDLPKHHSLANRQLSLQFTAQYVWRYCGAAQSVTLVTRNQDQRDRVHLRQGSFTPSVFLAEFPPPSEPWRPSHPHHFWIFGFLEKHELWQQLGVKLSLWIHSNKLMFGWWSDSNQTVNLLKFNSHSNWNNQLMKLSSCSRSTRQIPSSKTSSRDRRRETETQRWAACGAESELHANTC